MASPSQPEVVPQRRQKAISSLRTNFKWTLVGNIVYSLCQWGMLSVLAKAGTVDMVGRFALGLAISAPVFMFLNLQLRSVQATDSRREYRFADYFTLRVFTTGVGLLVIIAIVFTFPYAQFVRIVIILVALTKCIECISDVIGGLLQLHERLDQVAISLMFRGVFAIFAFSSAFSFTHSLIASLGAMVLAWLAVLLGYDIRRAGEVLLPGEAWFHMEWIVARKLFLVSLPLGLVMTLLSLTTNIPRYVLERYGGTTEVGIFAALAYSIVALNLVVQALSQSVMTRLAYLFSQRMFKDFCGLLLKLSTFGIIIVVAGVPLSLIFGRRLLNILYSPQYGQHVFTLAILVGASGISATAFFITSGLNSARRFREQVPVFILSTLTVMLGSLILVPRFQLSGAAAALFLSSVVGLLGNIWVLRSTLRSALGVSKELDPRLA
jgi:O-antigen/teichoic acid export membrane protein